ncbi:MAG: hypothetical protein OWU32_05575 [Firmicutes bacterium]|nr:hypothetical protein [Bacillota bacterium]
MRPEITAVLQNIKEEINAEYGFHEGIPRINYGPCGVGLHSREDYSEEFVIDEMLVYDEATLDKWSYGLDRTYPRFCPSFRRSFVENTVQSNLETLLSQDVPWDR